jgi:hypothetical protein
MCADQPELTFIFWAIQNFNFCVGMAQSIVNSGSVLTAVSAKLADTFGGDFDEVRAILVPWTQSSIY